MLLFKTLRVMFPSSSKHLGLWYVALLMILSHAVGIDGNVPKFDVKCNENGIHITMTFAKPFEGVIFAKDHFLEPHCSVTSELPFLDDHLTLPLVGCGTFVDKEKKIPIAINTIVVQQHRMLKTSKDYVQLIACELDPLDEYFWIETLFPLYAPIDPPKVKPSLELKLGLEVLGEKEATLLGLTYKHLLVIRLQDKGMQDVLIKNCIAHDEATLTGNTSLYQMTKYYPCSNAPSESLSSFTVLKTNEGLMAFAELKALQMSSSGELYITCEINFCRDSCVCPKTNKWQTESFTAIVSNKLTKRSNLSSRSNFSRVRKGKRSTSEKLERREIMRSLIKTFSEKLLPHKALLNNELEKRAMGLANEPDSAFNTDLSPINAPVVSTKMGIPAFDSNLIENEGKMFNDDSAVYEAKNLNSDLEIKITSATPSPSATSSTVTSLSLSTTSVVSSPFTTSSTTRDIPIVAIPTAEADNLLLMNQDLVSSNETRDAVESMDIVNTVGTSLYDWEGGFEDRAQGFFLIGMIMLGFSLFCIVALICGLALSLRKEKKRSKIDSFLLYPHY